MNTPTVPDGMTDAAVTESLAVPVVEEEESFEVGEPLSPMAASILGDAVDAGEQQLIEEPAQPVAEPAAPAAAEAAPVEDMDVGFSYEDEFKPARASGYQTYATSGPRTSGTPDTVVIPPATGDVLKERLAALPNIDMMVSENQKRWADALKEGLQHVPMAGSYTDTVNREGADFHQAVNFNGIELRARSASLNNKKSGTYEVEGSRALIQMLAHLGTGGLARVPLWNTGIWVTFRPASDDELIELNRIIQSDRVALGRWSYGLALSNSIVYTLERIFDFVCNHVYNTSVKAEELPIEKLRDVIAPQDIFSFIWGFLCANYPSGFHYETPCVANPDKCTRIEEETMNVSKLQWADISTLSERQLAHMSAMTANVKTLESVMRYQEDCAHTNKRRIILNEGTKHEIAFTLKTPSVSFYIQQGRQWINDIVNSIDRVLTIDNDDKERNRLINLRGKASVLCQYVHWIESIEFGNLTGAVDNPDDRSIAVIKDTNSIMQTLASLSATDSIRDAIIEAVLKYIDETTIAVIGVPSYECPVCHGVVKGSDRYPRHTSIVPLDVIQVFFALLGQRLSRIETR